MTKTGTKIPKEEYLTTGKNIIIDQGKDSIAGYTDRQKGIFKEVPVIVFGDHTRIVKYVDKPFFLGADGVKVLKSREKESNYKYLYYALKAAHIPNTGYNRHFKWLKQININYPDFNEQKNIVDILDSLTRIIKVRQKELAFFDKLIKARFVEMFGDPGLNKKSYPVKKFSEFAEIDTKSTHDYHKYAHYPHIGIENIEKHTGRLVNYKTVKEDKIKSSKFLFTKYHIIYSKLRPNLNKVAIPNFNGLCSSDAYPILPNAMMCNRIYLAYVMRSDWFLKYIIPQSTGTNLPRVSKKVINNFKWPLAPLSLQNEFANFVQQVDKSKVAVQKSLNETQKLYDSLMQEYFG